MRRGLQAGAIAGTTTAAAMYLAALVTGIRPLPDLLSEPVLALMPGPVFGFLIDRLQHLGKVLEEASLLLAMIAALALLGAAYTAVLARRRVPQLGLLTGAVAWAVTCLLVLPLGGDGLLGLNEGVATPLVWAVLYLVYAVLLEAAATPAPSSVDEGRRRIPLALAGIAVLVLGARLLPGWYRTVLSAPENAVTGPSPELTPTADFYVVSKNFSDPSVATAGWTLQVTGLVENQLRLSYQQLRALPAHTQYTTLECVSNNVGGPQISTGQFTGVLLADLVDMARPGGSAQALAFKARDGYEESIPLSLLADGLEVLVAYDLNGSPLPASHGFPARILIPGHYGMKGPKWLDSIEVVPKVVDGYWENQGWNRDAVVKTMSRIDVPTDGAIVKGTVEVAGVAFAGVRGIQRVDVSTDGGRTWTDAQLKPPLSPLTWTLWTYQWTPSNSGQYSLQVRATDGGGQLQSADSRPSYPDGSSGYHSVRVNFG
ncbi:MAG TPA: molybdopterin-dependent oxidoreductase [Candidatus Dormibacteraeota bacterium]